MRERVRVRGGGLQERNAGEVRKRESDRWMLGSCERERWETERGEIRGVTMMCKAVEGRGGEKGRGGRKGGDDIKKSSLVLDAQKVGREGERREGKEGRERKGGREKKRSSPPLLPSSSPHLDTLDISSSCIP